LLHWTGNAQELRNILLRYSALSRTSLSPQKAEKWLTLQIQERWKDLLGRSPQDERTTRRIWQTLRNSGSRSTTAKTRSGRRIRRHAQGFERGMVDTIYSNVDGFNDSAIDRLIRFSRIRPAIPAGKVQKNVDAAQGACENMDQLEKNTNFLLRHVLNGGRTAVHRNYGGARKTARAREGKNP